MPKLKIQHKSASPADEVFTKIRTFFETDVDIKKIDSSVQCQFNPQTLLGTAKGSQFTAQIQVIKIAAGCDIQVEIEIPFLLTPLKGKIQETVQKKLEKYLG